MMNRVLVLAAIMAASALCWSESARAQAGDVTIECASLGYQAASCPTGLRDAEVTLVQQLSRGRGQCIEGRTWSTDGSTVFVNGGCRAVFRARARVFTLECSSQNYGPTTCPVAGPVESVRLLQQLSNGRGQCVQGSSWSHDTQNIYVSGGCRAVFEVTRGNGARPNPPLPPPPPVYNPPPRPLPPPPPPYEPLPWPQPPYYRACDSEPADVFQATFRRMKQFAYSTSGLDMTDSAATSFALEWTRRYSCAAADEYLREAQKIRAMAYNTSGFNMTSAAAAEYVQQVMDRRCQPNVDYLGEARKHYSFAYSTSGLNLSSSQAEAYAREQMERLYFACPGRPR